MSFVFHEQGFDSSLCLYSIITSFVDGASQNPERPSVSLQLVQNKFDTATF